MKLLMVVALTLITVQAGVAQDGSIITKSEGLAIGLGYDYAGYGLSVRSGGISGLIGTAAWGLSLSGDYAILNESIGALKGLEWYGGVGAYALLVNSDYGGGTSFGVRGTAGLLWAASEKIEIFSQVSPTLAFGEYWNGFYFGYSAGIRYRL